MIEPPARMVRCSDADRERTAGRLRDAAAAGCLTVDELDERLAGAYAARHGHELAALTDDLPRRSAPAVAAMVWAQVRLGQRRRAAAVVAAVAVGGLALAGLDVID